MKKLKSILLSIIFAIMFAFIGFSGNVKMAHATNFLLPYSEYSEEVLKILNEFCAYKTRIAGSENEKEASKYIQSYLKSNATKLSAKNDTSTVDGIQSFNFISDFSGVYETSQNVIFEYKSAIETNKKVILACNYDAPLKYNEETGEFISYENDALNASASSVSAMLMLAQTLPNYSLSYNLEFVFFGASESSFAGSEFYLNGLSEDSAKNILCVINLDEIAFGNNIYFYLDEVKTDFSKYVSSVCSKFSKEIELTHLNKTEFVGNKLGLAYSHIGLDSDNVNFMNRGIATINMFAGDYERGIVMGRCEYSGKEPITYTQNDTIEYAQKNIGATEIVDNLYTVNSTIETLLNDSGFVKNASKSFGQNAWFYTIFANEKLVLWCSMVAFVVILIIAMWIHFKLTKKSYYANIEIEFLSSVVKISDHVDKRPESDGKDVAKVVGQVIANDIKRNKMLRPEKKKKNKK